MPFRTTVPSSVEEGTRMPPGHMQNEKTPRSSTCWTKEYSAVGMKGWYLPW